MEVILVDVCDEGFVTRRQAGCFVCELRIKIVKGTFGFLQVQKWQHYRNVLFRNLQQLTCCKTGLNVDGKTRNIAIQLVLQQCCKTSCMFLLPVLPCL